MHKGSIFDVAVDIRMGVKFRYWSAYKLKADDKHSIFIPIGFAHGFMTLEKDTEVIYQCDNEYSMSSEGMIKWNDADIGIDWPNEFASKISEKDKNAKAIKHTYSFFIRCSVMKILITGGLGFIGSAMVRLAIQRAFRRECDCLSAACKLMSRM